MRALSIRQPWAALILHEGKDVENRSWRTSHRGPILIHASKGMRDDEWDEAMDFVDTIVPLVDVTARLRRRSRARRALCGGIVGRAVLVDCVLQSRSPWWCPGHYGFVLTEVETLPFRPCRGLLGIFEVAGDDDAVRALG